MTGRLAPGVNVEPAMPGRYCREFGEVDARRGDDLAFRHQGQRHEHVVDDQGGVVGSWGWPTCPGPPWAAAPRRWPDAAP